MARSTFKHIFYINRSKQKKNGRYPLMGRITIDGEQVQYSLGENIASEDWDSRLGRAKGKNEHIRQLHLCYTAHSILPQRAIRKRGYCLLGVELQFHRGFEFLSQEGAGLIVSHDTDSCYLPA